MDRRSCRASIEEKHRNLNGSRIYWDLSRKEKEGSIERESVDDLSRSCHAWRKKVFQERKNIKRWMQQASYSNKDPINMLSSQNISQHISKASIDPNTHTHKKQDLPILYLKNRLRQFSKHILTHVFLMMAKSHCTCACIKSSKE